MLVIMLAPSLACLTRLTTPNPAIPKTILSQCFPPISLQQSGWEALPFIGTKPITHIDISYSTAFIDNVPLHEITKVNFGVAM